MRTASLQLWQALVLGCLSASCSGVPEPSRPRRPGNVILLVVDTLRADHLGSHGSTLALTPHLDRFAEDATVFLNAVAQGSNTINSAPCLLASVFLSEHGYTNYKLAVSQDHLTLAESLAEAGYETFAVSTNPNVTARNGLAQGFETFVADTTWEDTDAATVNRIFLDWLETRPTGKPFFAMLWYIDPHVPYEPPAALVDDHVAPELRHLVGQRTKMPGSLGKRGEKLSDDEKVVAKALYRGEVAYFDEHFGQLVEELKARGLFDDSLIVFTSDHGESFWEHLGPHGRPLYGHGVSLYREETAVPLLIKLPGGRLAGSVSARVSSIDVAPTVTELVGLARNSAARGASLLPLMDGRGRDESDAYSISELLTDFRGSVDIRQQSIETEEGKLIVTYKYRSKVFRPPLMQLVDLMNHEEEISPDDPPASAVKKRLSRRLRSWEAGLRPVPPQGTDSGTRDAELRKRLEALGYVD